MLKIGCHLSSSKGYVHMAQEAQSIGANTFQFFTRNPRGGSVKALDMTDVNSFLSLSAELGIETILAHAPYTLNGCSADEKIREFALSVMKDDILRLEATPGNLYNFHPGSHVGQGVDVGIEYICDMLNKALFPEMTTTVLLETMAGKGSEIGRSFHEIRRIIDSVDLPEKLGVCLDTCHVYDAGYDIVSNLDAVLEEFDKTIGIERLRAVHLNDSKNPFESHKDRHEKIGLGSIGEDTFEKVINHELLRNLPFYLETPNELCGYAEEIKLLKKLYIERKE